MAPLIDRIYEYTKDSNGVPKKWEWNKCDCIGLMFHIVNSTTGRKLKREYYIPSDLDYKRAIQWLYDAHSDPLQPYLRYLVDDSGLMVYNRSDWNMALMYSDKPIDTNTGIYPINVVPGLAFKPKGHPPYVMSMQGLAQAKIYKRSIKDFIGFKIGV